MKEDAIKAFSKATNILKTVLGTGHVRTMELMATLQLLKREQNAKALNVQAMAMKVQGDSEKAMQLFQKSLLIYNEMLNAPHPYVAAVHTNMSAPVFIEMISIL
ncbi:unnamed protein product [Cylindrotheca closterium]|uniref:Kinesin light chain n=1 Tax=Cylindrotheca closterium TaxID=2856 RepID=A0AAD2FKL3_9STRA|nr:unnamed protein product [Cylindrotheca closterium]